MSEQAEGNSSLHYDNQPKDFQENDEYKSGAAKVGKTIALGAKDVAELAEQPEEAKFKYKSEGAWFSKMVVNYSLNGEPIEKKASGSGRIIAVPLTATDVEVKFQVHRPFWGDIMKYDRFEKKWCKPYEPHVFRYEEPPLQRTFTISGNLWREAVMRVSDEYDEETREMDGYIQSKCKTFMPGLIFSTFPLGRDFFLVFNKTKLMGKCKDFAPRGRMAFKPVFYWRIFSREATFGQLTLS